MEELMAIMVLGTVAACSWTLEPGKR